MATNASSGPNRAAVLDGRPADETDRVRDVREPADQRADAERRADDGLSAAEARQRLDRYGPNAIQEERHSLLLEVLGHFWGPSPG